MCLHDDVNVSGSELSVRHHQQKQEPCFRPGLLSVSITRSLCPVEQGGCRSGQEEKEYMEHLQTPNALLEIEDQMLKASEHPNTLPRYVTITSTALHFTFPYDQFYNMSLSKYDIN